MLRIPSNLSQIEAKVILKCNIDNIEYDKITKFSYNQKWMQWPDNTLPLEKLNDLSSVNNKLIFKIKIEIIQIFDMNEKPIIDKNNWSEYGIIV